MNDLAAVFHAVAVERTPFADPAVRRYAQELAQDHAARGARLGSSRGLTRASDGWRGALAEVVQACGWRGAFSPFAGDAEFLLASHVVQTACADAFRVGARHGSDLSKMAGESAYHAALVRTALAATASARPVLPVAEAVDRYFARLREGAPAADPLRSALRTLFLKPERVTRGGFLPQGLRGAI